MAYTLAADVDRNPETGKIAMTRDGYYRFSLIIRPIEGEGEIRMKGFRLSKGGAIGMPSVSVKGFYYPLASMDDATRERIAASVMASIKAEEEGLKHE